jgi:hypothetical protein
MTREDLEAEELLILPMRLETIVITGGPVNQRFVVSQTNVNNQVGDDCLKSGCDQTNAGVNIVKVKQDVTTETKLKDVIEDQTKFFRGF